MATSIRSTVFDVIKWRKPSAVPSLSRIEEPSQRTGGESNSNETQNDEYRLPKMASLVIILATNSLLQISFFIIVSSSNLYVEHLGGGSSFSGLVIGIPLLFSGIALIPLMKIDKGGYKLPLHIACFMSFLGSVIYALAYKADYLYLILIGRIVSGFSFTFFLYSKRYCSDARLVGVRRRTMLAGWLVLGQGFGFSLGPFLGGLLYKAVGFGENGSQDIFNGFTSPAWIMAGVWLVFWVIAAMFFEDVEPAVLRPTISAPDAQGIELQPLGTSPRSTAEEPEPVQTTPGQWGVIVTMCWFAMTCFFVLGAWESNIPIFTASDISSLHYSPFDSGNLIALGGATIFPFLFLNLYFGPRIQDRFTLATGSLLGFIGLMIMLGVLSESPEDVKFPTLFISWVLVALGFNLASTCTLSLLSKKLPAEWNRRLSLAIQYSNYAGRVSGAVWGGSGVTVGMKNYVGLEIVLVGIGAVLFSTLWKDLKAKTG